MLFGLHQRILNWQLFVKSVFTYLYVNMRGSESFRKTNISLIQLFSFLEIISFPTGFFFHTFFYCSFQKLKLKAEQDKVEELKSVNEVLESYGY